MRVIALLSGGKDSLFNLYLAKQQGHEIVAIANLKPHDQDRDELDSFMYQTVGHQAIELIAEALEKPLFRANITGYSVNKDLNYQEPEENGQNQDEEEVEQLYKLLYDIMHKHSIQFDCISVGAIHSSYQKSRVENICARLNITMLAYLWEQDQDQLLQKMIDSKFDAILIKVACLGLDKGDVGQSLEAMQDKLRQLKKDYGVNICGEGGEFESLVLDCPLYKKRLILDSHEIICLTDNDIAPVYYMRPTKMHLEDKSARELM